MAMVLDFYTMQVSSTSSTVLTCSFLETFCISYAKIFLGILTARESNKKVDIEYSDSSDSEDDKREEIISDLINER